MQEYCSTGAKVILAIETLAKEGLDISSANTLIIFLPIKDIEQPVGRIDRGFDNGDPLVIYFKYDISLYASFYYGKKGARYWFKQLGHKVVETNKYNQYL